MPSPTPAPTLPGVVERHDRIIEVMRLTNAVGDPYTAKQRNELIASRASLDAIQPPAAQYVESAMSSDHRLIREAADGRTTNVIRAMQLEAEMRGSPALRADVFVSRWQGLERQRIALRRDHEDGKIKAVEKDHDRHGQEPGARSAG